MDLLKFVTIGAIPLTTTTYDWGTLKTFNIGQDYRKEVPAKGFSPRTIQLALSDKVAISDEAIKNGYFSDSMCVEMVDETIGVSNKGAFKVITSDDVKHRLPNDEHRLYILINTDKLSSETSDDVDKTIYGNVFFPELQDNSDIKLLTSGLSIQNSTRTIKTNDGKSIERNITSAAHLLAIDNLESGTTKIIKWTSSKNSNTLNYLVIKDYSVYVFTVYKDEDNSYDMYSLGHVDDFDRLTPEAEERVINEILDKCEDYEKENKWISIKDAKLDKIYPPERKVENKRPFNKKPNQFKKNGYKKPYNKNKYNSK